MNRRQFFTSSFAAPMLMSVSATSACASTQSRGLEVHKNLLEQILSLAMTSTNPHNTQAWIFHKVGVNKVTIALDSSRFLPHTDPIQRQIMIGFGCMLKTLEYAANCYGYKANFEELDVDDFRTGKPIVGLTLEPSEQAPPELMMALLSRRTIRTHYKLEAIPENIKRKISSLNPSNSAMEISWLPTKDNGILRKECFRAMEIETNLKKKHGESLKWFRFTMSEIEKHRDGISLYTSMSELKAWFAGLFIISRDNWYEQDTIKSSLDHFRDQLEQTPQFVSISTPNQNFRDWIKAGKLYQDFQLEAQKHGLYLHPLSQILQEYDEMQGLQRAFNKRLAVKQGHKIQMLLRVGKPIHMDGRHSPRRDVKELLRG
ncbi:hypothetical protein [Pseudobacteriovorax antillogorgiicola]|uniref:Nitroreductase family protein n=1 Tax=Pseudobacteriovorax antillogorgiicola TaxID=1513793 RepID=A0A1Y6CPC6_9BACT|nr:hypothetical protein [Pseudobacteriovorax antillogorgiicola]TCS46366.1 nitroreductase family protein [Pseudobacteriovorax antillogorgiicola]SMF68489.1 hypothetical protein SAMN06296036_12430 [Pseudobacteriovorax antillogorgiicola]